MENVHLIEPLDYFSFVWLMNRAFLILTDSGGIQEEAPSLGKPILVMRKTTERTEGLEAGTAKLVGTASKDILDEATKLICDKRQYERMTKAANPYGDGKASDRIYNVLLDRLSNPAHPFRQRTKREEMPIHEDRHNWSCRVHRGEPGAQPVGAGIDVSWGSTISPTD